jgi:hypothetical protein
VTDPTLDHPVPGASGDLLPENENLNPVWGVPPRRRLRNPARTANADEENTRVPGGFATILPEDWAAAGAPDAVQVGEGGRTSLDINVVIAYLVSAVQHCHEGLARRVIREQELQAQIDALTVIVNQHIEAKSNKAHK